MRIQFFPEPELEDKLNEEAKKQGIDLNSLVNDVLNKYYGLVDPNKKTEAQLIKEVLDEVAEYVKKTEEDEFDLNMASKTYSQIDMTYVGKPKVTKARIGKIFSKKIGNDTRFKNVEQVFLKNGNPKKSVGNRAALYRVVPKIPK